MSAEVFEIARIVIDRLDISQKQQIVNLLIAELTGQAVHTPPATPAKRQDRKALQQKILAHLKERANQSISDIADALDAGKPDVRAAIRKLRTNNQVGMSGNRINAVYFIIEDRVATQTKSKKDR